LNQRKFLAKVVSKNKAKYVKSMDPRAKEIINELLTLESNEIRRSELETELKEFSGLYQVYLNFKTDYEQVIVGVPPNPFFLSKLKNSINADSKWQPLLRKVQWAPYAILASLGIAFGVFLGNQVDYTSVQDEDSITEEFMISEYEIDDPFLLVVND